MQCFKSNLCLGMVLELSEAPDQTGYGFEGIVENVYKDGFLLRVGDQFAFFRWDTSWDTSARFKLECPVLESAEMIKNFQATIKFSFVGSPFTPDEIRQKIESHLRGAVGEMLFGYVGFDVGEEVGSFEIDVK